jgi:hypothetical protein
MSCPRALAIGLLLLLCGPLSACELVADFDRSKLDAGAPGTLDASQEDDSGVTNVTTSTAVKSN